MEGACDADRSSLDEGLGCEGSLGSVLSLVTGGASSECIPHREPSHADTALRNLHLYLQSGQLTDVLLCAGDARIPAHKIILAASSEYFAAMFMGSLREAKQNEITLDGVDPTALQSLIQYCYTGTIDIREETVEVLLATSCLLQLNPVTSACCSFLMRQLDPCNCLGIMLFAEQQSCVRLHQRATDYTYQNYMQVVKQQEFLTLEMKDLANLLTSEDLNVHSEENVFESLMTWVQHNPTNREKHLPALLQLIKLPLLSSEYLIDKVETACGKVPECQPLIMEAVKWHLLPERRAHLSSRRTRPRTSTIGRLIAVGGKGATNMEVYDPRSNEWTPLIQMVARRMQFGVTVVQNKLLIVGGRDGLKTLNTVECFDLTSRCWSNLAPMNTHRHGLGVAVVGDGPNAPVYAVGGHDGWIYLNSVERWDACARTWFLVAPMMGARSTCGVTVAGGKLYAAGGRDGSGCLRSVECYDPATNRWTNCAPMHKRRGGVSVCAAGGFIYALGGHEAPANLAMGRLACVERYDPTTDSWLMLAQLSCPRDAIGSCLLGDRIVAVGGHDGVQYLCVVELYDPRTDTWKSLAPLGAGCAWRVVAVPNPRQIQPATPTTHPLAHTS